MQHPVHTCFLLSVLFIKYVHPARSKYTFGCSKCSISSLAITNTGNWLNDIYITSVVTALTVALPTVSTKSTSKCKRAIELSYAHITILSITHSSERTTTTSHYTTSRSGDSTKFQCLPTILFSKITQMPLIMSETRLWNHCLAHIHPTASQSLFDTYTKNTQWALHVAMWSTSRSSSMLKPCGLQSHVSLYIQMCINHSLCLPLPLLQVYCIHQQIFMRPLGFGSPGYKVDNMQLRQLTSSGPKCLHEIGTETISLE